ncbi:glycosyltransferase [Bifidobacterium sp. ESL0790]|uniref:glycosyltransferase n=1 Tax=Bifidobacterium sp. ESL0790 TaxID=2983233 RepID=UPI0023FA1E4E|nr:glycosyltransferase [Bifidobacterium sp. ESL0790]WEV71827.1 glycosyltransferase [Bifidobacterium sp. ESL0790]
MALVVILIEALPLNMPFWSSFGASTDTASVTNPMGSGLSRQADGTLRVTDPANAYLSVTSDGSSPYVRIDPSITPGASHAGHAAAHKAGRVHEPLTSVHVRMDVDGTTSPTKALSTEVPQSLYLAMPRQGKSITLWIQEPVGSDIPFLAVRANAKVPFHFDWGRVAAMLVLALLVALWWPGSRLWRIPLDTGSTKQRAAFWVFALALAAMAVSRIASALANPSGTFHAAGGYTYDFNQYGHLADALIHGRTSIDLPVPQGLKQAGNPYDPQARETLLAQGVSPIYWDYAFHDGKWFTYFGVLPALLLFAPYRIITSWFVPGGLMLPSSAAVALLLLGVAIFGSLLVIRLIGRVAPRASLATVSLALALVAVGSNAGYLAFRMNFYTIPFAASLLLSAMGLWLWMGAGETNPDGNGNGNGHDQGQGRRHHRHLITFDSAPSLSKPHLAAGALCIAANFGCRPTFIVVALLALPLFWPQIRLALPRVESTKRDTRSLLAACGAVLLPALVVLAPLMAYNQVRFGSPIDFGERYQLTVADMTRQRPSPINLLPAIGYYLFLPLRPSPGFPFLAIDPAPLPTWTYVEPMVGGLVALCPALVCALALLLPKTRRRLRAHGLLATVWAMLTLAAILMVLDAMKGGLGWRYIIDFGWLVSLATVAALPSLLGEDAEDDGLLRLKETSTSKEGISLAERRKEFQMVPGWAHIGWRRYLARLVVMVLVVASLAIAFMALFVPGRDDALTNTNPALFHEVQSWFEII